MLASHIFSLLFYYFLVLYCTLLARTNDDDERQAIEEEMKKDPDTHRILKALSKIEGEDLVQEELARKAAARKSRVDADLDAEDASQQEKKAVRKQALFPFNSIIFWLTCLISLLKMYWIFHCWQCKVLIASLLARFYVAI